MRITTYSVTAVRGCTPPPPWDKILSGFSTLSGKHGLGVKHCHQTGLGQFYLCRHGHGAVHQQMLSPRTARCLGSFLWLWSFPAPGQQLCRASRSHSSWEAPNCPWWDQAGLHHVLWQWLSQSRLCSVRKGGVISLLVVSCILSCFQWTIL